MRYNTKIIYTFEKNEILKYCVYRKFLTERPEQTV